MTASMTHDRICSMEELTDHLREGLNNCLERGMSPPFILCGVSPNGSICCMRCPLDGATPEMLADHNELPGFKVPVNTMVVDSLGKAALLIIEGPGVAATAHYH
jgi:hypothetical protein